MGNTGYITSKHRGGSEAIVPLVRIVMCRLHIHFTPHFPVDCNIDCFDFNAFSLLSIPEVTNDGGNGSLTTALTTTELFPSYTVNILPIFLLLRLNSLFAVSLFRLTAKSQPSTYLDFITSTELTQSDVITKATLRSSEYEA